MIRAHQPGSQPMDIPEVVPNPAVVPKQEPVPKALFGKAVAGPLSH